MKIGKKWFAAFLIFALCVGTVAGCGKKEDETTSSTETLTEEGSTDQGMNGEYARWALLMKSTWSPYDAELQKGVEDAMKEQYGEGNFELVVYDADGDAEQQVKDLNDCISAGYPVVFVNAVNSTGLEEAAASAKEAGIILIALDTLLDNSESFVSTVVNDHYQAGMLCAQKLAEALGDSGEIAVYQNSASHASDLWGDGFIETIEGTYPTMEIVNRQEGNGNSVEDAMSIMKKILDGTPNISGLFALNDASAQGCVSVIKDAGKQDQIKVVSVGGSKAARELIKAGELLGSAAQFPGRIGSQGVEIAVNALSGLEVASEVLVPTEWMDSTNCDTLQNYDY